MRRHREVLVLTLVMALVAAGACGITLLLLYRAAIRQQGERLTAIAHSQACLLEAVHHFDLEESTDFPGGAFAATLSQLAKAHRDFQGFGETGEFALARREDDRLVFLLNHRGTLIDAPAPVALEPGFAEPMRRALAGESGVMTGRDYRGVTVLAAYEPLPSLGMGIVAKLDLSEVRGPFLRAGLVAGVVAVLLIGLGAVLVRRVGGGLAMRAGATERTLARVLEISPIGIAHLEGRAFRWVSDQAPDITGYEPEELAGADTRLLYADDESYERSWAELERQIAATGRAVLELSLRKKDGTPVEVFLHGRPVDPDRPEAGTIVAALDITSRRRAEERVRLIARAAGDPIVGMDEEGRITLWNPAAERMFGYTEDEVLGRAANVTLFPPRSHPGFHEAMRAVLGETSKTIRIVELTGRRKDGAELTVELTLSAFGNGRGQYVTGILRDVSESRRAEAMSRAMHRIVSASATSTRLAELYSAIHAALADLIPVPNLYIALLENESDTLEFPYFVDEKNDQPGSIHREEGIAGYVLELDRPVLLDAAAIARLAEEVDLSPSGTIPNAYLGAPLRAGERTVGVLGIQSYDEERVYGEDELRILEIVSVQIGQAIARRLDRSQRERLAAVVEQASELIVMTDREGRIEYVNPSFERVTGFTAAEALGRKPSILKSGRHEPSYYAGMWESILAGQGWSGRIVNRSKSGGTFVVDATISPLRGEGGTITGFASTQRDVSREVALQDRLAVGQRMEAVGRLAGGITHDFGNLLTIVTGYAELLSSGYSPQDPRHEHTAAILEAAGRATDLTRQLLAFSKGQVLSPVVLDVNSVVVSLESLLRRLLGSGVELVLRPGSGKLRVRADRSQVEQVLLNLVVNARDALRGGGRVAIETSECALSAERPGLVTEVDPGDYVRIAVTDTGAGMSADTLMHAFEPFFSTKRERGGTGLGLATVHGIVTQSGGSLAVSSRPGEGTTFEIFLPRVDAEPDAAPAPSPEPAGRRTTALVAGEDRRLRELSVSVLEAEGHEVLVAKNATEARAIAERRPGEIGLLVVDLDLSDGEAFDVEATVRELGPGCRVLVVSGGAGTPPPVAGKAVPHLIKPYSVEALRLAIRRAVGD